MNCLPTTVPTLGVMLTRDASETTVTDSLEGRIFS